MKKPGRWGLKIRRRLGGVLLLGLSLLPFGDVFCLTSPAAGAEPAFVELVLPKESNPWVGQRTVFSVDVIVEGRFSGSTLFDLPQVPGVILMKPEERSVLSTRTIENKEYAVQRHDFSLFCQNDAGVRIPEIKVRCGSIRSQGETPIQHTLTVPEFGVTPRLPEGARPGQVVVATTRLEVTETWNPKPGDVKVGDAFRRTVTLQATDVPGMLLPLMPQPRLQGLAVYPSAPGIEDRLERGDFTGKRVDTLTYVCERPGTVEIPAVSYRWWNPEKSAWEEQRLPAVTLKIAVNPTGEHKESSDEAPVGPTSQGYGWWLCVFALGGAVGFFALRRRKPDRKDRAFREVLQACRNNDAGGVYNAWTRWRFLAGASAVLPPVGVTDELVSAQRMIAGIETSWNGRKLEKALQTWQRGARKRKPLLSAAGKLPELNPGG
jgi:hypothetical protein